MFPPNLLKDHGVPVFKAVQYPGEFIITFPRAYHAGFSHGFNCGEAVNFAMRDWFSFGAEACLRYEFLNRFPLLPHEELLCKEATIIDSVDQAGQKDSSHEQQASVKMAFVALMKSLSQVKLTLEQKGAKMITTKVVDVFCGLCKHKCHIAYTHCKCFSEPTCFNHGDYFSTCSCEGDRVILLRNDFANLQLVAHTFEGEESRKKQAQKSLLVNATVDQGDHAPSRGTSEAFESSLITNAMPSMEACGKQEDGEDVCSGNSFSLSETGGVIAALDCRLAKEEQEEESDAEALQIKRRRVASPQSKRFQVNEQEIAQDKSLVRSLDCGGSSPVREQEGIDKQELTLAPMIRADQVSVHQVISELNIKGSAAEVISQWQDDARRRGMILKIREVTVGQKCVKVFPLKSLSCLKHLVSREEADILQRLMLEVESRCNRHGNLASLATQSRGREVHDLRQKSGKRKALDVTPDVRPTQLTVFTEECVSHHRLHSGGDKQQSPESKCMDLRDVTSMAGSAMLSDEFVVQELHDIKVSGGVLKGDEDGPEVKDPMQTLCGDSRIQFVSFKPDFTATGGDSCREAECSSFDLVSKEPDSSVPSKESIAPSPKAAIHPTEDRDSYKKTNLTSSAAQVEKCKSVMAHFDNTEMGNELKKGAGWAEEVGRCSVGEAHTLCNESLQALEKGINLSGSAAKAQPSVDLDALGERRHNASSAADAKPSGDCDKPEVIRDDHDKPAEGSPVDVEARRERSYEASPLADARSHKNCDTLVLTRIDCDKATETRPLVALEVRERHYESSPTVQARSSDDCGNSKVTSTSSCAPKRGLIIHLNRRVEQRHKNAAKLTFDEHKSDSEFDQVDIFEGQTGEDVFCPDQEMMGCYSGWKEGEPGELIFPLECPPMGCGGDFVQHHGKGDDIQVSFAERLEMRAERYPEEGERSVVGHQLGNSVVPYGGSEFPFAEYNEDAVRLCSNYEPNNCPINGPFFAKEEHKLEAVESIILFSSREADTSPDEFGERQKIDLSGEEVLSAGACTFGENHATSLNSGPEAHRLFSGSSRKREEAFGSKVVDRGPKTDPYKGGSLYWGRPLLRGQHELPSHHHPAHQTAFRKGGDRYKHRMKSSPRLHHSYHRDIHGSGKYPRLFHERERLPGGYWKRRPNRGYNTGRRDTNNRNTLHGDFHGIKGWERLGKDSASTSEGTGHVEGYDPVKWEISPSAVNHWQFASTAHHLSSPWVGRGFP